MLYGKKVRQGENQFKKERKMSRMREMKDGVRSFAGSFTTLQDVSQHIFIHWDMVQI